RFDSESHPVGAGRHNPEARSPSLAGKRNGEEIAMADLAQERQQAHAFLDRLPPEQLAAVRGLLETMLDPIDRKLTRAPLEDEPESEEARQPAAEAGESLEQNGGVPMEQVPADFGLTMEDFRHMAESDSPEGKQP